VKVPEKLQPSMPFIVRIKGAGAIGLGFCVDETHIITCAHVVKDVLGLDQYPRKAPKHKVTVEFPYADGATRKASVLDWHPRVSDGRRIEDIAVLVLDNRKPETVPAAVIVRGETLFSHPFWALGYTAGSPNGIWSHGEMCPPLPNGRLQIENPKDKGIAIEYGFSGTPVWDEELNGVVGMVVEASLRKRDAGAGNIVGSGIAFVMPIDVLVDAWPGLEEITLPESKDREMPQSYIVLNEGNTHYNLGRYEEAIARYDKALEIDPHYLNAWNNKGVSLDELGRREEAIACYDKALEIDPRYVKVWYNRGLSLDILSRFEEAIACYDKALEIDPQDAASWYNKGVSFQNSDRDEEAIACYDKALEIDPHKTNAWNNKGSSLATLSRDEEAIACYDKALEIDPSYANAWYNKGLSLYNLNRYQEAIACYDKALEIDPQNADVLRDKGQAQTAALVKLGLNFGYEKLKKWFGGG
jgi:tetratricopeptide (TPR) repeat protein